MVAPRKPANQAIGQGGLGSVTSAGVETHRPEGNSGAWSAGGMSAESHRGSLDEVEDGVRTRVLRHQPSGPAICTE